MAELRGLTLRLVVALVGDVRARQVAGAQGDEQALTYCAAPSGLAWNIQVHGCLNRWQHPNQESVELAW